jgi:hypothetical protein
MMQFFMRPNPAKRAADELAQAHLDKLQADAYAEHWKHVSGMLDERIARLTHIVERQPQPAKAARSLFHWSL